MPQGLETFELAWSNNQDYITSLISTLTDSAGFTFVSLGVLDTFTNAYTITGSLGSGTGKKLVGIVTTTLGVSLSIVVVTATYHNQFGVANNATVAFNQGSSVGTSKTLYLATGDELSNVTIASAAPTTSGKIQLLTPLSAIETFDNTQWGPPDPGL